MATPTIPNGEEYFFPVIYEGNGAGQRVGKFVPFTDNGTIDNSCIFNGATNNYLSRTPSSNGSGTTLTFSCWVKRGNLGVRDIMFTNDFSANGEVLQFDASNRLYYYKVTSGWSYVSNRTFEDTSKWYNIVIVRNTNDSTASDRVKIYVDGDRITSFSSSSDPSSGATGFWNQTTYANVVGNTGNASYPRGIGYLAEVNMVDGTAMDVSTFGVTDTSTGRWIPKTLSGITYGTNGFRLKFQDSSALGDDTSGNTNDFTATNLASTDQTTDSPTQNFNNMGGSKNSGTTVAEGNLETTTPSGGTGYLQIVGLPAFGVNKGKWYWEVKITTVGTGLYGWKDDGNAGGSQASNSGTIGSGGNFAGALSAGSSGSYSAGSWFIDHDYNNEVNYTTVATNDVLMFALDLDNNKGYCGKNGTWFNSADPANGTGAIGGTQRANGVNKFYPMCARLGGSASTGEWNFGQRSFAYTAPTGFSALQQDNLPETSKGVSGLVWTKNRDSTDNHQLYDSSRGKQLVLTSNTTSGEATVTDGLQKFLAGGQQIEDDVSINTAGESFVSWNWVANSGTTSTNTDGSISSTVQANTTAGFSIVEFTTPSSTQDFTTGHGLSVAPRVFFFKRTDSTSGWAFYHQDVFDTYGNQYTLFLNTNNAAYAPNPGTAMYPSATTATTFSLRANASIAASANCVAYCWNEVDGFSKFGKYTGNSSADGPFVYTGFKPVWVLFKSNNAANWYLHDSTRSPNNPIEDLLYPNLAVAENNNSVNGGVDFLSNGFKIRQPTGYGYNYSGTDTYYMAFAEHPFFGDGTNPVTAR